MIFDIKERNKALDPESSFIVQAPAGSGKTGLLVYRYLTLLARVDKPQNVLAITFTRKARAEMRERILELLLAAQNEQRSDDAFEQQGIDLAAKVLERDKKEAWQLLIAPHQMQILTIDAFSAKLAASMPWLSRLGERPNTSDSAHSHFAFAVDQVLDELLQEEDSNLSDALKIVMYELDFNYDKARHLFSSMLTKRDQWLRHLVQQDLNQIKSDLEHSWALLLDEKLLAVRLLFSKPTLTELISVAVGAAQRIDFSSSRAPQSMKFLLDFEGGIDGLKHCHWQALIDFLLVKSRDKIRSAVNKNLGFPTNNNDKEQCLALLNELRDDAELIAALADLGDLPIASYNDYDWRSLVALETVLKALAVRLQLRFRSVGECDHSEVTQRANLALSELNNPTDLGLLMDGQIHHILVDEFQDTSTSQLELLKKLTVGWQVDDPLKRTIFLVGDPMQSIYRFREADVGLFLQVANNSHTRVFDNINVNYLVLSQNFRSSESLVTWFNTTFEKSFPQKDDVLTGAIGYSPAQSNKPNSLISPVSCRLLANRDDEAQALLEAVQEALLHLPDDKSQIAILVRSRPQLNYLLPILDSHGIAYSAVDIQSLSDQQSIKDVIALAEAICRDDDKLALLALLRGPWCGLSISEVHRFNKTQEPTLWAALHNETVQQELNSQAQVRLRRFLSIMRLAKQQHQQVELGSLVRWAWLLLGGKETLGSTYYQDIEQVFDLLNALQRGGDLHSKKELEEGLTRLSACAVQNDKSKVIVSTIHKSKGLQYHTVILPGLNNKPRSNDREILMWAEYQSVDGGAQLLMAPLLFDDKLSNKGNATHYNFLRKLDSKRANNEVMRLMYVACTRAEHKLVLLANIKRQEKEGETTDQVVSPYKASLLASVWPALEGQLDPPPLNQTIIANKDSTLDQTLLRIPADHEPMVLKDFVWDSFEQLNATEVQTDNVEINFDWATEVATAVGVILHDFLQFNGRRTLTMAINDHLKRRWRVELLALHVPNNRIEFALRRLLSAVQNMQEDSNAHFIFDDYADAKNEYAITTLENGVVKNYRLDRTFVDHKGTRWIVDYKSTTTNNEDVTLFVDQQVKERHAAQLEKYGELMSKIDSRPIKLAVYFPLLKQLRSWDFVSNQEV